MSFSKTWSYTSRLSLSLFLEEYGLGGALPDVGVLVIESIDPLVRLALLNAFFACVEFISFLRAWSDSRLTAEFNPLDTRFRLVSESFPRLLVMFCITTGFPHMVSLNAGAFGGVDKGGAPIDSKKTPNPLIDKAKHASVSGGIYLVNWISRAIGILVGTSQTKWTQAVWAVKSHEYRVENSIPVTQ